MDEWLVNQFYVSLLAYVVYLFNLYNFVNEDQIIDNTSCLLSKAYGLTFSRTVVVSDPVLG